jgi:hypothetical protein
VAPCAQIDDVVQETAQLWIVLGRVGWKSGGHAKGNVVPRLGRIDGTNEIVVLGSAVAIVRKFDLLAPWAANTPSIHGAERLDIGGHSVSFRSHDRAAFRRPRALYVRVVCTMIVPFAFKALASAPFRLNVRPNNTHATDPLTPREGAQREGAPRDAAPGSHLARRRGSDARLEAVPGKRREESGPPTKPSIAPPSPRPNPRPSTLGDASPLLQLERAAPTLTYNLVIVLATAALGLGGLMAAWSGVRQGGSWLTGTLLFVAVSTLIFSASMAVLITLSFTRRLRVLAESAWRLAQGGKPELPLAPPKGDALTTLAHGVTRMAERIAALTGELEQAVEAEQARVDELVRERVRTLAREAEDYRRMVGESRGLLTLDREGRVVAQSSVLETWLGAMPRSVQFWEYLERSSVGLGPRFETAWARAVQERATAPDLTAMPTSLVVGQRHFALEYKGVLDVEGKLDRVLVLVTDVTIPAPDPATTTRAPD